ARVLRRRSALALVVLALAPAGCSLGEGAGGPSFNSNGTDSSSLEGLERFSLLSLATANTTRLGGAEPADDAAAAAVAAFPGTSEQAQPSAVMLVDRDNWQGAVAASVLSGRPIGAPILVSDGESLPDVSQAALDQMKPKGSDLSRDAQVIKIGSEPPTPEDHRTALIGGDDPYALAAAIDRFSTVARGDPSPNVIVASGESPEWSMPAGAWSARSGDSVLFTLQDELPPETERALGIHERPNIYVLGPEDAVGREVEDRLRRFGNVRRIEGRTPVENALNFARYRQGAFGWGLVVPGFHFTLANLDRPLDAAAAAPLATNGIYAPLLLTDTAEPLPKPLEDYFLDVRPGFQNDPRTAVYNHVWLLGDTSAITAAVQGRLDEIARLIPVQIAGERPPAPPDGQGPPAPDGDRGRGSQPPDRGQDQRRGGRQQDGGGQGARGRRGRDD
ncbi:MAG TPA: cell wall-binding repeat-containing protein, partial [Thermoleophilaceae bacterium]|nr:cell wall-binding repeat-containing protein [Thermoleophilaceae bacterium]